MINAIKKRPGRPRHDITFEDWKRIEAMALMQCTQEEISQVMGISVRTLKRQKRFAEVIEKGKQEGRASLRRMQWKLAEGEVDNATGKKKPGNVAMQIWLGKQYLGQKDRAEVEEIRKVTWEEIAKKVKETDDD